MEDSRIIEKINKRILELEVNLNELNEQRNSLSVVDKHYISDINYLALVISKYEFTIKELKQLLNN